MINNLTENPKYCITFSSYRTKQNILKKKIGAELVQKEWNVCSAGFNNQDECNELAFFSKKGGNRRFSKCNTESVSKKFFLEEHKSKKRKSESELKCIKTKLFPQKSKFARGHHKSPLNLEMSVKENNKHGLGTLVPSIHLSSVFLEVQNIQNSFQKDKCKVNLKPPVKLPPEFTKKFRADLLSKDTRQQSNLQCAHKSFQTDKSNFQIKPELKLSTEFVKKFKTDPILKNTRVLENVQNIQNCFQNNKAAQLKPPVKVSNESSKQLPHKTNFISKNIQEDKLHFIQNSFREDETLIKYKSPMTLLSKLARNFNIDLTHQKTEEGESMPKKRKLVHSSFIIPSTDFSQSCAMHKVQKLSVSVEPFPTLEHDTHVTTVSNRPSVVLVANKDTVCESTGSLQTLNFHRDHEKVPPEVLKRNKISRVEFSALLEDKCVRDKGSNWLQSLQCASTVEYVETDGEDYVGKKKIRNILQGGFAEKMLKLQRRENSDKVIWNHKIEGGKKALQNSLFLALTSVSFVEDMVITKASSLCLLPEKESDKLGKVGAKTSFRSNSTNFTNTKLDGTGSEEASMNLLNSKTFIILFKRNVFAKLHLKVNDTFMLYEPWQTLVLKSIPYPVILCAYFIDVVPCNEIENEIVKKIMPSISGTCEAIMLKKTIHTENATHGDLLFYKWGELVSFSARIQRIWKKEIRNCSLTPAATEYLRYSVILQVREGTLHELLFSSDTIPNFWYSFVSRSEGRCYRFHNLRVTHRIQLKRHKYFHDVLQSLQQQNRNQMTQEFCYQLMCDSSSRIPEEIEEEGFPAYCPVTFKPLLSILEEGTLERVTCIGKILLRYKDVFYISDESLRNSSSPRYIQMQFLSTPESTFPLLLGSPVLIKEVLFREGYLLLDNYSQLIPLCESSDLYRQLSPCDKVRVKQVTNVGLESKIPSLNICSEVTDLVCIEGEIISVDESAALTWLQCSFCLQENLVQDLNLVIYCEDCSRVVPSPILNVKLEVAVHCQGLSSAIVNVQLLSSTIKRILQIAEDAHQPQCSVNDVLGKEIGPLYCYVRSFESVGDKPVFYLSEVDSC